MDVYQDERVDYIGNGSTKIIQSPNVFAFSLDAVLLAHFAYVPIKRGKILDLCSGNGIIPLLLAGRTHAQIMGLEIQARLYDMAVRSVAGNSLESQITMRHGDLREKQSEIGQSQFDVVTCNPPYFPTPATTEHNRSAHFTIARHEVNCTLDDVVSAMKLYVRPGGKVAMVHRPGRLMDVLTVLRHYKLEPKRLQLVYPKQGKEANMLLIEAVRDGKPNLKIHPPLYIYNQDNTYTEEAEAIIYG